MPIPPDLAWTLSDQLGHAYSVMLGTARGALADERLGVPELVALVILQSFPEGLTQTAWGEYQGVTRQRAHTMANTLAAEGLVDVAKQNRSSTVTLSRAGRDLIARLQPHTSNALAAVFEGLSTAEARELSRLLSKLLT